MNAPADTLLLDEPPAATISQRIMNATWDFFTDSELERLLSEGEQYA